MNDRQRWIMDRVGRVGVVCCRDVRVAFSVGTMAVWCDLVRLVAMGALKRYGRGPGTYYRLPGADHVENERQRWVMARVGCEGEVRSREVQATFSVGRSTAHRDLAGLVAMGKLVRRGAGRLAYYALPEAGR
ncbi:hypothetical protein ES708_23596 [subsurface metagenome]